MPAEVLLTPRNVNLHFISTHSSSGLCSASYSTLCVTTSQSYVYSFHYIRRLFSDIGLSINTQPIYRFEPIWRKAINLSNSLPLKVTFNTLNKNTKRTDRETNWQQAVIQWQEFYSSLNNPISIQIKAKFKGPCRLKRIVLRMKRRH
jgi:hypothetical protein